MDYEKRIDFIDGRVLFVRQMVNLVNFVGGKSTEIKKYFFLLWKGKVSSPSSPRRIKTEKCNYFGGAIINLQCYGLKIGKNDELVNFGELI